MILTRSCVHVLTRILCETCRSPYSRPAAPSPQSLLNAAGHTSASVSPTDDALLLFFCRVAQGSDGGRLAASGGRTGRLGEVELVGALLPLGLLDELRVVREVLWQDDAAPC